MKVKNKTREYKEFAKSLKIKTLTHKIFNTYGDNYLMAIKLCEDDENNKYLLSEKIEMETGWWDQPVELWVYCDFFILEKEDEKHMEEMLEALLNSNFTEYEEKWKYSYLYSLPPYGLRNRANDDYLIRVNKHEYGPYNKQWYNNDGCETVPFPKTRCK